MKSKDNEQYVLGSLMLEPHKLNHITFLSSEDFYYITNSHIFQIIIDLSESFESVSYMTVFNEVRKRKLEKQISINFLMELTTNVNRTKDLVHISKIIFEDSLKRKTDKLFRIAIKQINDKEDISEVIENVQNELQKSLELRADKDNIHVSDAAKEYIENNQSDKFQTYKLGFIALDDNIALQPGDLMILAAGTSHGKTAAALQFALNFAKKNIPIAKFSLEMSSSQVANRLISNIADIKNAVFKYKLQTENLKKYKQAVKDIKSLPIYINDKAGINIIQLKGYLKRLVEKNGVKGAVVDYLQLMSSIKNTNTREQEVASITRALKSLAKELNIFIIALSQLSRAFETQGRKPRLSDLRESGAIEQDADIVIILYNYLKAGINDFGNKIAFLNEKNRGGQCFETAIKFNGDYQRFYEEILFDDIEPNKEFDIPF
jgi:replicative DNA helicase